MSWSGASRSAASTKSSAHWTARCYSIDALTKIGRAGVVSNETRVERGVERRATVGRATPERRFAERRAPERATVGRRVIFVPDRRSDERRITDRPGFEQARREAPAPAALVRPG